MPFQITYRRWWLAGMNTKPTMDGVGMTREQFTQGRHDRSTRRSGGASQNGGLQQSLRGMSRRKALQKVQAAVHACFMEVHHHALQSIPYSLHGILVTAKERELCPAQVHQ